MPNDDGGIVIIVSEGYSGLPQKNLRLALGHYSGLGWRGLASNLWRGGGSTDINLPPPPILPLMTEMYGRKPRGGIYRKIVSEEVPSFCCMNNQNNMLE